MTTLTHESLSRMIMLSVQFRDFGHYEMIDGKRCYVTTREQTDNLQTACDRAAKVVLEHIEVAQAQTVTREQMIGQIAGAWAIHSAHSRTLDGLHARQLLEKGRFIASGEAGAIADGLSILGRASDQKEGA